MAFKEISNAGRVMNVRPTRPFEWVEMDDTKLDLFVLDEKTKLPIGRPWLFVATDVFTKMILGYYLCVFVPDACRSCNVCYTAFDRKLI
jgi:putative transposase